MISGSIKFDYKGKCRHDPHYTTKRVCMETVIWWLGPSHHTLDWVHRLWGKFLNDGWDSRLGMFSELMPIKKHTSPWDRDIMETVVVQACDVGQAAPHAYEQMTPHGLAHCLSAFFPLSPVMKCSVWPGFVSAFFFWCMLILKQRRQAPPPPPPQASDPGVLYMCVTACVWSQCYL